jgi:hypothetical protein
MYLVTSKHYSSLISIFYFKRHNQALLKQHKIFILLLFSLNSYFHCLSLLEYYPDVRYFYDSKTFADNFVLLLCYKNIYINCDSTNKIFSCVLRFSVFKSFLVIINVIINAFIISILFIIVIKICQVLNLKTIIKQEI